MPTGVYVTATPFFPQSSVWRVFCIINDIILAKLEHTVFYVWCQGKWIKYQLKHSDIFLNLRPILFRLEPEFAHHIVIKGLKYFPFGAAANDYGAILQQNLWGLEFKNPVGLAAGFDKNAEATVSMLNLPFWFLECGTVTPKPQDGNPKPRIFRLKKDNAVINRLGFNNNGAEIVHENIKALPADRQTVVGINIGKNKDSDSITDDYIILLNLFYNDADYITINISSPNTPGLRNLQTGDYLDTLLSNIHDAARASEKASLKRTPILLKIAPDLEMDELEHIAEKVMKYGVDGVIVSNTTISKKNNLKTIEYASEEGWLSGQPLFEQSTAILDAFYALTKGRIPLIGVGGISSGSDAYKKIRAGASLVQLYTGLIYQGIGLVDKINRELIQLLKQDGYGHISQAIGADHH